MTAKSHTFTHAITRRPSASIINGLREADTGTPDLDVFLQHHADYVSALESTGAQVVTLEALAEYPDSVFVEDAALCLQEVAIKMRPGAPSRLGEADEIAPALEALYDTVCRLMAPVSLMAVTFWSPSGKFSLAPPRGPTRPGLPN